GPVATAEAYMFIRKSHFGINYIPDLIPYNHQTSAKFLDYAVCGIPIVSTDYFWIREFQKNRRGEYFFLDKKFNQFNWKEISGFKYQNPVLDGLDWNSRIRESGILEFLQSKFIGLQF
ncbi:MAG TPA: hypothetical protein VFV08_00620, partial [Puia sp.]|nr:hypothetical protein [Puia sp.]